MNEVATTKLEDTAVADYGISIAGMPMGLAILFNDKLYERCKEVARRVAGAEGFTPPHLLGKVEACFAVVTRAITWKLDPQAVAQSTFQTPGGRVGYEGKLIQAILENSGRLEGNVKYDHRGDWGKIKGKFELKKGQSGKEYPVPTWTRADAKGLSVVVSAKVKGELEPRALEVDLDDMFPLNSTLWATRPRQQICYTACRAFANIACPGLLMGEPFDVDRDSAVGMRDITPARPQISDFDDPKTAVKQPEPATDPETGEVKTDAAGEDPRPEFSAADAHELGREARRQNKALGAVPPEWRNGTNDSFAAAWQAGWRDEDEVLSKQKGGDAGG